MKIVVTSVLVDDQEKALRFYTDVLGFLKKNDIPLGHHRWLTVVSTGDPDGVELLLEPDEHPAARPFKRLSWRTAFPTRRSVSTTCKPSTTGFARRVCISHSRPWRWGRSRRRFSMTPVATSSRLHKSTEGPRRNKLPELSSFAPRRSVLSRSERRHLFWCGYAPGEFRLGIAGPAW